MSTRRNAGLYTGEIPDFGGEGNIGDIIARLLGQDNVQGGPSFNPATGKFDYKQYEGSKGVFGGKSRRQAIELNRSIAGPAFLQQQKGDIDISTDKARGEIQKALEVLRSKNVITEQEHKGVIDRLGFQEQGKQSRETATSGQRGKVLEGLGIQQTPENEKVADQLLTDPTLRNLYLQTQMQDQYLTDPNTTKTFIQGQQAKNVAPMYANQATARMTATPGGVAVQPSLDPNKVPEILRGATPNQEVEMVGGIRNKKTGQMEFQTPKVTNNYLPASFGNVMPTVATADLIARAMQQQAPQNKGPASHVNDAETMANPSFRTTPSVGNDYENDYDAEFGQSVTNNPLTQGLNNPVPLSKVNAPATMSTMPQRPGMGEYYDNPMNVFKGLFNVLGKEFDENGNLVPKGYRLNPSGIGPAYIPAQ